MKQVKFFIILGLLIASIVIFGCSSKQMNETPPMPQEKSQISQNNAQTPAQITAAVPDEKDIQTSNDDFSQIDTALNTY